MAYVLVEAAGVEPASEIAVSQECSCFARFLWVRFRRSEQQDAQKTSPMISRLQHGRAATASLLYDVRSQPVGKAVEDGSLFN